MFDDTQWQKVVRGDQDAWTELVRRYAGLVSTVALRVGLDAFDAEDCAQQTWTALYRYRRAIRDPHRLPAWLILTTKRNAIRLLKRRGRLLDTVMQLEPAPISVPPDEELLQLEQWDLLQHAIGRLDARCQRLLTALFLSTENLSYREIASSLGISPNAMGPLRARCLKRLKKFLKELE